MHTRPLTIEDVKRRFIDTPPSPETVFLLTYTVARLKGIVGLPGHALNNLRRTAPAQPAL